MGDSADVSYRAALRAAVGAAQTAAEILRAECARSGGPRGPMGHCPADEEAEYAIRARLLEACPTWGYRGEETGFQSAQPGESHMWLVDPNDGTEAMQGGFRGHAVSIAALRNGEPVLGVVFAVNAPDDDGDLFAWAEGCGPMLRNGLPLAERSWPAVLGAHDVVFVSHAADRHPYGNLRCVQPARFRDVPSIAYRLALAAAEGGAAASLNSPGGHDYAAGHALLKSVGGTLVNEHGADVRYTPDGSSHVMHCFGGGAEVTRELASRPWRAVRGNGFGISEPPVGLIPVRLAPGELVHNTGVLRRAQGCLLGQVAGDALGALVEFRSADSISREYLDGGPCLLNDGGPHSIMAGQPTDDSELALLLARSLIRRGTFDLEDVASLYAGWYHGWLHSQGTDACAHPGCRPFDIGGTTAQALGAVQPKDAQLLRSADVCCSAASMSSQANGALMRVSPLGIYGWKLDPEEADKAARADASLTHPHPVCQAASGLYAATIAHAVAYGGTPGEVYEWALQWASTREARDMPENLIDALRAACTSPPADYQHQQGWVLIALQNAFYRLLNEENAVEAVVGTIRAGGDTDTNAAICGALVGAVYGREGWPQQWQRMVISCRPLFEVTPALRPRPAAVWPSDVHQIAERLLSN